MKNVKKFFGIVALAAVVFILASCEKKGGTIEVYNSLSTTSYVIVVKGVDVVDAVKRLNDGGGDAINSGSTKTYSYDEDATYTVVAVPPTSVFTKTVVLLGDNTEKVTIKD